MQLEIVKWRTSNGRLFHAVCERVNYYNIKPIHVYKDDNNWVSNNYKKQISLREDNSAAKRFIFNIPDTNDPKKYLEENYPEIFISKKKFLETYPEFKL